MTDTISQRKWKVKRINRVSNVCLKRNSVLHSITLQSNSEEDLGTSFSDIGQSVEAKLLGDQVGKLVEFTTKTAFLFFPYENSISMLSDYLDSPPVQDEIEKSKSPVKSRETAKALQKMTSMYMDLVDEDEMEPPFETEDRGRFLALLAFSLSAFVDVFTNKLLSRVLENKVICSYMVELLKEELGDIMFQKDLNRLSKKPHEAMKKIVRRHAPRNAHRKMNFILESLGILPIFSEIASRFKIDEYEKKFKEFLEVRQKVAHGNPCPPVEAFDNQFIRKGLKPLLEPIQAISHPITTTPLYQMIIGFFTSQIPMLAVSMRLPIMAIAYPFMVDIAVDLKLETDSELIVT